MGQCHRLPRGATVATTAPAPVPPGAHGERKRSYHEGHEAPRVLGGRIQRVGRVGVTEQIDGERASGHKQRVVSNIHQSEGNKAQRQSRVRRRQQIGG